MLEAEETGLLLSLLLSCLLGLFCLGGLLLLSLDMRNVVPYCLGTNLLGMDALGEVEELVGVVLFDTSPLNVFGVLLV